MTNQLNYFITLNKITDEFILQEGNLISLKIPKQWQKLDSNVNNPALWVCHLPENSLRITNISFYPNHVVIKKKKDNYQEIEGQLKETDAYQEKFLDTYSGVLEFNGENDKEKFYRCKLDITKKENYDNEWGWGSFVGLIVLIILAVVLVSFMHGRQSL